MSFDILFDHINIGGPDQSPEQHQPLLGSSGNDTSSRHDSMDSHTSTDDGFGFNDTWSTVAKFVFFYPKSILIMFFFLILNRSKPTPTQSVPTNESLVLINTAQPRPQSNANIRQLPSLPISVRQLPTVGPMSPVKPYFDIDNAENDEEDLAARFTHPGELFYYETSSQSSNSNNSSLENSDNENNDEQFVNNNQEIDDEEEEDGEEGEIEDDECFDEDDEQRFNQRLKSDEEDEQTSPCEYET